MHSTISSTHHSNRGRRALIVLPALLLLVAVGAAWGESYPLVMAQGESQVLTFDRMKRVAVADPLIADVAVASLNQLLVIGKGPGRTMLYVWDSAGQHNYAI